MEPEQNIITPYHRNKEMLYYTTRLLDKIIPNEIETIIAGNNNNLNELKVDLPKRFTYIEYDELMLYSKAANLGVEASHGDIITLYDQDVSSYRDWYTPFLKSYYPVIVLDQ